MAKNKGVIKESAEKDAEAAESQEETAEKVEEAVEETADESQDDADEKEKQRQQEIDDARAEAKRLQEENERLKRESDGKPKVTASYLRTLDEDQRENLEKQVGMKFSEILRNVEANEARTQEERRISTDIRLNVNEAIADAIERDPQLAKVKSHIREYINDLPDSVKADAGKLKAYMSKAARYARGAAPASVAKRTPGSTSRYSPRADENEAEEESDPTKGQIKPGVYRVGDLKLEIKDLVPKEKREKMKNPEHATGIRMSADFDEAPRFHGR